MSKNPAGTANWEMYQIEKKTVCTSGSTQWHSKKKLIKLKAVKVKTKKKCSKKWPWKN